MTSNIKTSKQVTQLNQWENLQLSEEQLKKLKGGIIIVEEIVMG